MNKRILLSTCVLGITVLLGEQVQARTIIWGLDKVAQTSSRSSAPYIVRIGAFASHQNAVMIESRLKAKGYPATIVKKKNLYEVSVGPVSSLAELHRLSGTTVTPHKLARKAVRSPMVSTQPAVHKIVYKEMDTLQNKWFVLAQAGGLASQNHGNFLIDNGSDFPAPENVDIYSSQQREQGTIALTLGKQIPVQSAIFNQYTLSARLQYLIPENVGDTIMQYSLPQFLNYTYSRKLSALALTADTKINLLHLAIVSPYLNGGIGVSFNRMNSYSETALSGVTARVSPGFANHSSTQFTYHVGAGLDFALADSWSCSVGYEFEDFGRFSSGSGQWTWATAGVLPFGSYHANTALFGLTHLID